MERQEKPMASSLVRRSLRCISLAWLLAGLAACGNSTSVGGNTVSSPPDVPGTAGLQIKVLSNRADLISGGDALVEVVMPANAKAQGLSVQVGASDESSQFAKRADGRVLGL